MMGDQSCRQIRRKQTFENRHEVKGMERGMLLLSKRRGNMQYLRSGVLGVSFNAE